MKIATKFIITMFILGSLIMGGLFFTTKYVIIPWHTDTLTQKAREVAYYLQNTAPHLTKEQLQKKLASFVHEQKDLSYICILDNDGKALVHSNPQRVGMVFDDAGTLTTARDGQRVEQIYIRDQDNPDSIYHGERIFDIMVPYYDLEGIHVGAVNVGLSLERIDKLIFRYYQIISINVGIFILFLLLMTYGHFREVIHPISVISNMARRLGEGNPNHLIKINRTDEIGVLINEFNEMSRKITTEISQRKRVEEELTATNEELTATNEQLISMDEELRYTNEKLSQDLATRKQMQQELVRHNNYLTSLHDTTLDLMNRLDINDLLETILRRAGSLLGTNHGWLYLADEEQSKLVMKMAMGYYEDYKGLILQPGEALSGKVWITGEPLFVENYNTWPDRHANFSPSVYGNIAFPIKSEGKAVGVIGLAFEEEGVKVDQQELALLSNFSQLASIALDNAKLYTSAQREVDERKRTEEKIRYQALHDQLTDLPNRTLFYDRLTQAIAHCRRHNKYLAVMFMDLDSFKLINDTMGHDMGDRLLKAIGERLGGIIRESDTVARIGGDEFTILLPNLSYQVDSALVAEKIIKSFKEPFYLDNREFYVTASIGISVFPLDGEDVKTLVKHADIAMYQAKGQGRNTYCYFKPAMNEKSVLRVDLENSLRRGLVRDEFIVYYQPQIDVLTGHIVGVEALLRWNHPQRGIISPGDFITVAEETGIIVPIGEMVLRKACAQCRQWQDEGFSELSVAVNLSVRQFQQLNLLQGIAEILTETRLEPRHLKFEITESTALQDDAITITTLNELRNMGISIAIDDFGTGYSSLSYLHKLPIDVLKIDKSFIRDFTGRRVDDDIIGTIINLAHNLKLKVIAEGVETHEQLQYLKAKQCDIVQGYLFHRPMPPEELTEILKGEHFV